MLLTEDKKLPQNRIAELRKKKKLSQAQLAKETGLTRQAISLYEISKREPKLETWIKLADFFDVPVSYLQGISNNVNVFQYQDLEEAAKLNEFKKVHSGSTVKINDLNFKITSKEKAKEFYVNKLIPKIINDDEIKMFLQIYTQIKDDKSLKGSYEKLILFLNTLVLYTSGNCSKEDVNRNLNNFLNMFDKEDVKN